ncbi:alpha/beta hydrolase [Pendulispora brunnea]|uniref:Alpha/beta hydrolase n=1 Tax=Pendulispora brunnea TaxID=2905690 RepID=A0ABZ2KAA5_9BACT
MKRPIIVALAGAALSVAVLTPAAGATPTPSTIAWGACSDPTLTNAGAECGTLDVPLDPANPRGKTVTLALSRVRHKVADNDYQGVVLGAPDALTGSGLNMSLLGARIPNGAGGAYDWVGFARRGQAPSAPAISCDPGHFAYNRPYYVPATPAAEQQWLSHTKAYADACAKNAPADLLDHMKTVDMAADMDAIRIALGVERVNLYAQSYGTYLAQVYATKYPGRVRRMVLDSIVDPRRVWYGAGAFDQNVPLQRNLEIWFDWLASHDDVYHLGKTRQDLRNVWNAQVQKLATAPAAGVIGPSEWIDVFLYPSYFQQTWPLLGGVFSNWVNKGDAEALKAFFSQVYHVGGESTYAPQLAQLCTDAPWPTSWGQWHADSVASHAQAPVTTWGNTWANAPCFFWPARSGYPVTVYGSWGQTALLVDETLDAATPFEGSLEVRSRFPSAALVSVPGGTNHAGTLSGNACVDSKIADYLATGALPRRKPGRVADVECAPLPLPAPATP